MPSRPKATKASRKDGKRSASGPSPPLIVPAETAPPVFRVPLRDVMSHPVVTVKPGQSAQAAAKTMNRHRVGCVVVLDQGRAVGIATERDILKLVARKATCKGVSVEDIMGSPLVVAPPDLDLASAIRLMVMRGIKKLPVMDGSRLVGIVTLEDFARIEPIFNSLFLEALQEANEAARRHLRKHVHDKPPAWTFI